MPNTLVWTKALGVSIERSTCDSAESHVDRSIDTPSAFVHTNVLGTFTLLHEARRYYELRERDGLPFRFLHVSTDEVFGSLESSTDKFTPETPYDPRSPYSATKAASDHLVRAWGHTYGLPVVLTNCSNNYGPVIVRAVGEHHRQSIRMPPCAHEMIGRRLCG